MVDTRSGQDMPDNAQTFGHVVKLHQLSPYPRHDTIWESNIPTIWHARKRVTAQNTAAEAVPDKDSEPLDEQ